MNLKSNANFHSRSQNTKILEILESNNNNIPECTVISSWYNSSFQQNTGSFSFTGASTLKEITCRSTLPFLEYSNRYNWKVPGIFWTISQLLIRRKSLIMQQLYLCILLSVILMSSVSYFMSAYCYKCWLSEEFVCIWFCKSIMQKWKKKYKTLLKNNNNVTSF